VSSQDWPQAGIASENHIQVIAQSQAKASTPQINQGVAPAASSGRDGLDRLSAATDTAGYQSGRLTVPLAVDDPGYAGSGRASKPSPSRSIHGTINLSSIQTRNRLLPGQASIPTVDTAAMARDVVDASGSARTAGVSAEGLATTKTGPESPDAFATLDAAVTEPRATWIHADTQRAEAGFQDPALGWVGVRANTSGGGVHAELLPGSADAAQALGSHMAGLNAYLAEHHMPVETLTMTAPEGGWSGIGSDQSAGQNMQQGAGQQAGQEMAQNTDGGSHFPAFRDSTALPAVASELPALKAELDGSAQLAWLKSGHISVMA
jgi:hypothetical protein